VKSSRRSILVAKFLVGLFHSFYSYFLHFHLLNLKIVMHDPNTDIIQWESGAIVLYLIEQYDTEKKLTLDSVKEKAMLYQWLMFQMSGQGPFYGQLSWYRPHLSSIMSHVS